MRDIVGESGGHVISGQVMGGRVGGQVEGSGHVSPEIARCVHIDKYC